MDAYREKYAIFIYDTKKSAEKVASKLGYSGIDELYRVLFENREFRKERKSIKRMIYKPLRKEYSDTYFCAHLREALIQDSFHFDPISEEESQQINVNGKKWIEAEQVFGRPRSCLRRIYNQATIFHKDGVYTLPEYCNTFVCILKYYPSLYYVIKDREIPKKHVTTKILIDKGTQYGIYNLMLRVKSIFRFVYRYWPVEDYATLFNFVLENSRETVLNSSITLIGLCYLSLPVDQYEHHVEFISRLIFLFVYYIDDISPSWTIRQFIEFLKKECVEGAEVLKLFLIKSYGMIGKQIEFRGWIRGFPLSYVDRSEALNDEVYKLNEMMIPEDEELKTILEEASQNDGDLFNAARYSGVIPTDMEHSEEMLDDEQWKIKRSMRKAKKAKKHDSYYYELSDSDNDEITKEPGELDESDELDELDKLDKLDELDKPKSHHSHSHKHKHQHHHRYEKKEKLMKIPQKIVKNISL